MWYPSSASAFGGGPRLSGGGVQPCKLRVLLSCYTQVDALTITGGRLYI